ncbi:MAG: hypothetical protein A2623_14790 [Caulobacterales bacterium RIFCSPHIGHO2_01_FULL_70_19]|nr:MAG: hypothetical protein A2623_14790 [Caulobacterales bacterium RIFCSPHIGHO2_01_FULL_70_19]
MARNPYAVRRDHTWLKRIALVVAGLAVLLLLAIYVLRPASSPAADARAAALEVQIDASEAASDRERAVEAERRAGSF